MVDIIRVIHQSMIERRRCIAKSRRQHKDGEGNVVGARNARIFASEVVQEIPLADEEDDGRNEVGVDIDRLVVKILPTAQRRAHRARDGPVAVQNRRVIVVLKPSRHLSKRA